MSFRCARAQGWGCESTMGQAEARMWHAVYQKAPAALKEVLTETQNAHVNSRRLVTDPMEGPAGYITPLHVAAHFGFAECASVLLAAGADPRADVEDAEHKKLPGTTPLDVARARGHVDLFPLLLGKEAGASAATPLPTPAAAAARPPSAASLFGPPGAAAAAAPGVNPYLLPAAPTGPIAVGAAAAAPQARPSSYFAQPVAPALQPRAFPAPVWTQPPAQPQPVPHMTPQQQQLHQQQMMMQWQMQQQQQQLHMQQQQQQQLYYQQQAAAAAAQQQQQHQPSFGYYSSGGALVPPPPYGAPATPSSQPHHWGIQHADLTFGKELGRGAFGIVYKGRWRFTDVAIKVIQGTPSPEDMRTFQAETELMMNLRPHKNVVQLRGVCAHPLCVIIDFVDGGSLEGRLADKVRETARARVGCFSSSRARVQAKPVEWPSIFRWAQGIVAGLLHIHLEGIVHRDLASRNVLLDATSNALISDFGLSAVGRPADVTNSIQQSTFFRGPYKWMAPESLMSNQFSVKSDVWSLGGEYGRELWQKKSSFWRPRSDFVGDSGTPPAV